MNLQKALPILLVPLILAACISSSCPPEAVTYLTAPFPPAVDGEAVQPQIVEIKGNEVLVDRVITGAVCNDTWNGTVYLTCDIQVPAWEKDPFFWQDCDLEIEEGAIVYVEAHKDKEYTDGCSCHE
jgi:hypothetical protein